MPRSESGFPLMPGVWTRLAHRMFDAEGAPIDGAEGELGCVFGYGALLPALEQGLDGLRAGARVKLELSPEQAFGERDPGAVLWVEREEFPEDVAPGDTFEAESETGVPLLLQVLDVTPEAVVIDRNHPLAGQRLRVEVEVKEVRPASELELAEAEARLRDDAPPIQGLILAERLLRGGRESYERIPSGGPRADRADVSTEPDDRVRRSPCD